jgi:hypothetical protein
MEYVDFEVKIDGNFLRITPIGGVKDNSIYEIRFKKIESILKNKTLKDKKIKIISNLTPCYVSIESVRILADVFGATEEEILFYIRDASKYADYIRNHCKTVPSINEVKFELEQFVKTKAILDALLKGYVDKSQLAGLKGVLGSLSFENGDTLGSIQNVINYFKDELRKWSDAIRGYHLEGRNTPKSAIKSMNSTQTFSFSKIISGSGYGR